jgi:hypothetical protein
MSIYEIHPRVRLNFYGHTKLTDGDAVDGFVEDDLLIKSAWPADYYCWRREPRHLYGWVSVSKKLSGDDALDAADALEAALMAQGFAAYTTYSVLWEGARDRHRAVEEWRFKRGIWGTWILAFKKGSCVLLRAQKGHVVPS